MSFHHTDWPHLFHNCGEKGRAALKDRMLGAFMEYNGNLPRTWESLGITSFSWYRYVGMLGIKEQLVSLREAMHGGKRKVKRDYADAKPRPKATPAISSSSVPVLGEEEVSGVWSV